MDSESLCFFFFAHGGGPDHDSLGYSKRAVLNLLFCLKKKILAVVMVQKQYEQKFVPGKY